MEQLEKVYSYLKEKEITGEFTFSTDFTSWSNAEGLIKPLHFGYLGYKYIRAVGLVYIIEQTDGHFSIPESEDVWGWAVALDFIASISDWTPDVFANVVNSFPEQKKECVIQLTNAVKSYCRVCFGNALKLHKRLPEYRIAIMAAMIECDFCQYKEHFPPTDDIDEFAKAFLLASHVDTITVEQVFDTAISFDSFVSSDALELFLKSKYYLNGARLRECKNRCLEILRIGSTHQFVSGVCNRISNNDKQFACECFTALIEGLDKEHADSLKTIDNAIAFNFMDDDPDICRTVALCIAEHLRPVYVVQMEHMLRSFRSTYEDLFIEFTLCFILNPKGEYRIAGRRIWDSYHLESSSFDIMSLPEDSQCIFIVFILQDYGNPETRLPKILPLFKSESKRVIATLESELRPYTDEYMGHVSKAIDDAKIDTDLSRKLKQYIDDRHESIVKRRNLKELSDSFAQYEFYREAIKVQCAGISRQIAEAENDNSSKDFLSMFKKQILARGGGWRNTDGTTQHLIPIKVSIPARIMTYSMMPYETNKWLEALMKDYDKSETGNS